jgi:outer membrane immunogenic protein
MNRLTLAAAAMLAFSGSALAADLPSQPYTKAPAMVQPPQSWTGFYVFGGIGGGVWDADGNTSAAGLGLTRDQRTGGNGWFGTVGAGYDWQFDRS